MFLVDLYKGKAKGESTTRRKVYVSESKAQEEMKKKIHMPLRRESLRLSWIYTKTKQKGKVQQEGKYIQVKVRPTNGWKKGNDTHAFKSRKFASLVNLY